MNRFALIAVVTFMGGALQAAKPPRAPKWEEIPTTLRLEYRVVAVENAEISATNLMAEKFFTALPADAKLVGSLAFNVNDGAPSSETKDELLQIENTARTVPGSDRIELNTFVQLFAKDGKRLQQIKTRLMLINGETAAVAGWISSSENGKKTPAMLVLVKADKMINPANAVGL